MDNYTRRSFLKSSIVAGLSLGALSSTFAVEPLKRVGAPRLRLSLAAYSFREYFNSKEAAKKIDLFQFIDYCAEQKLDGAELTSYYFPQNLTDDYILKLRRYAFLAGVEISGSAINNNFSFPKGEKRDQQLAHTKKWIDHSALLGAPHIRIFAWPQVTDLGEAKKNCIETLEEACDYAGTKGIFLGLENHGSIAQSPNDLMEIIRAVKSPWLGVNLDTGNFKTEDPYGDIARFAPYAVNVQFKIMIRPINSKEPQAADMKRVMKILRDANYQGYVALEHEAKEDPMQTVPKWLKKLRAAM
jgi:sugar phosphate isomerase/epimerase